MVTRTAVLAILLSTVMPAAERIVVHGHRGARSVLPENTLPAFLHAIEAGADAIELDLAVTSDNVLVVSHDPEINAAICTGPKPGATIRTLTLAEVREYDCGAKTLPSFPKQKAVPGTRIPTLDEVLALAPRGKFDFNIETKSFPTRPEVTPPPDEYARLLYDAIRKHKLDDRVMVQSFDFRTLHAFEKVAPHIRRNGLYMGKPKSFLEIAKEARVSTVAPHYSLVTPDEVRAAHAAGLKVVPWTANEPSVWDKLIAAGVDGIITDDPAALIAYLKKVTR